MIEDLLRNLGGLFILIFAGYLVSTDIWSAKFIKKRSVHRDHGVL